MTVDIPGVSDAEVAKMIATVTTNFEPRMIRVENTTVAMFGVLTVLSLLILFITLIVATHIILERRARRDAGITAQKKKTKLHKRTTDASDDSSTVDTDEEYIFRTKKSKRNPK